MSPGIIAAITQVTTTNHHVGRYVSATSTTGCKRRLKLERTVDYEVPLAALWASFRGTIIHGVIEAAAEMKLFDGKSLLDLGYLIEQHLKVGWCLDCAAPFTCKPTAAPDTFAEACPTCGSDQTFLFGGTLDMLGPAPFYGYGEFDPETGVLTCILEDNKTMADGYAMDHFIIGNNPEYAYHKHVKDDYVWQANIYQYLLKYVPIPANLVAKGVRKIVVDHSRIMAISMSKGAYLGSSVMHKSHWTKPEAEYPLPPVEFFDDDTIRSFIQENGKEIYDSLVTGKKRGPVIHPTPNKKHPHSYICALCAFAGTEYCPDSATEWAALQAGESEDEAFARATRVWKGEEEAPPPPPKEEKPKKPAKPRKLPKIIDTPEITALTMRSRVIVRELRDGAALFEQTSPRYQAVMQGGNVKVPVTVTKAVIDNLWKKAWLQQDGEGENLRYTLTDAGLAAAA